MIDSYREGRGKKKYPKKITTIRWSGEALMAARAGGRHARTAKAAAVCHLINL